MATSNWLLGVPDTSGDIFLANVNGVFQALATCSIGSSEPPVKSAGMMWFDLNDGRLKQRNQNNSVWVPIFAIRNNQCIPLYNGQEVSNIVAVQPKGDGYLRCKNGVFILESIDSPDIPMFGVNRSGIVPGVTSAQSNLPFILKSSGTWDPPGQRRVTDVSFTGAKEYAVGISMQSQRYSVCIESKLSGAQPLMMQIGSGGSPVQQGYRAVASRQSPTDTYNDIAAPSISSDKGFIFYRQYPNNVSPVIVLNAELYNPRGNAWVISGTAMSNVAGQQSNINVFGGSTSINGTLNYIRVLSSGSPVGSFNDQNSIDSGYMSVFA